MAKGYFVDHPSTVAELLNGVKHLAVLTGAGVSTDSGIEDFKSTDEQWPFEEPRAAMLSALFWRKNPRRFWEVYRFTLGSKANSSLEPGPFHRWLKELEDSGTRVSVLTQNVDGLHSRAGSSEVIEAHGSASRAVCLSCGEKVSMRPLEDVELPICNSQRCFGKRLKNPSYLKPDVSLFFEGVTGMAEFRRTLKSSQALLVAGTRLEVGPVNELPLLTMRSHRRNLPFRQPSVWVADQLPPDGYNFDYLEVGSVSDFVKSV